jgi:2-polyprenyl-3-methyl-5-hydroxy-6-metoxy-1,4-benzoquinol methylase
MKLGIIPETFLERVALALGLVPTPVYSVLPAIGIARSLIVATKLGLFEAIRDGSLSVSEISKRCHTDPRATEKMMNALVGSGYLRLKEDQYMLVPEVKKWLLRSGPRSFYDVLFWNDIEADWLSRAEDFVRTGQAINVHKEMSPEQWSSYERAMYAYARFIAVEVAWRLPMPRGAQKMLDIGGGHGYFSVALCRKYPELSATILDLPTAVQEAAPILERERMGKRVRLWAGDALTADLGEGELDLILIANLLHHFNEAQNRQLTHHAAQALRPGGVLAVMEFFQTEKKISPLWGLMDFYWALTSGSGALSPEEIRGWHREAGLLPKKTSRFFTAPFVGIQYAVKPQ